MSRFLWIEDFEDGIEHTAENVFESLFDYVTGLFQIFWHDLSPITVKSFIPTQNPQKICFEYKYDFDLNDYGKDDMESFLFELARSIYKRSFP
jgi:hypothetical protein